MNAAILCLIGLAVFTLGYRFYSGFIARRVFDLKPEEPVPAVTKEDGVDYVPTARGVLFGHHYASIAGAAPIIGPAIAMVWGWLPAFVWVVIGSVFMGAVHDFSALVISVRHEGKSIGQITESVIGPRSRSLFLLVIFCLILLVIAVFATAIARLFVAHPGTVIPINFEIVVALLIGWLCYKKKVKLLVPSIVALIALYVMVWVGVQVPVRFSSLAFIGEENQHLAWVSLLLCYSFVTSILPVWVLLQPRDYINSHQLFVGLGALIVGLMIAQPVMQAPAIATPPADAPSMLPFLFVTIACGAISGFHGLVSSGTTSKQLCCAADARPVGYGATLGEGLLALVATLAVGAGLADWAGHYHSFASAAKGGISAFVQGAATFLQPLGIPRGPAEVIVAVMVISFAATSLDTGVRIQRYILHELGESYGIEALKNRYLAAGIAVGLPFILYLSGQETVLWPLFGTTNQLLAGLSLLVITVWLYRSGRPWVYTGVPMVLVMLVSSAAMLINLGQYIAQENYLLLAVSGLLLALQVWVVFEAIGALKRPAGTAVSS